MEEANAEVLAKSEKISQKKKIILVWAITGLLIIVTLVFFFIDYSGYKKGQEFGLASAIISSEIGGESWVNKNDSYAKQCKDVYRKLNRHTYEMTLYGVKVDASDVRKSEDELRSSFAKVMRSAGYDRYNSYSIAAWFEYTNFAEYFSGYYWNDIFPICCYTVIAFPIVFTILVNCEAKKELVVYKDSVLCIVNPKKSKQLLFKDINNVDFGKNTLKLSGIGVKFKISNITNAENIKSVIIDKMKSEQIKSNSTNTSSADELKKYKDLLDSGVISQEEFETKKKQILGF